MIALPLSSREISQLHPTHIRVQYFSCKGIIFFLFSSCKRECHEENLFFILLEMIFATQIHFMQSDNLQQIEDVILAESSTIINSQALEDRLNAILSRAESYLLCGDNQKAISDYERASCLMDNLERPSDEEIYFSFRNNFGLMIAYLNENRENHAWKCYNILRTTLDELPCDAQASKYDYFAHRFVHPLDNQNDPTVLLVGRPIEGPDQIPVQDCLNLANNTERFCRILISYVKHSGAQVTLNLLIDGLVDSARGCCLSGGLWKACRGPLLQKWSKWDQRWQMFRLPPDPAND